ncbi:uncharacterized protein PgNI_12039 [Pyricularia grisea]|uniref:Uncharacterized protein n=1 Tax=Pyricularia grisea TaxID=148305 RepID=A0A6P8AQJ3_PYRGI|nr:uncharacterized protein PgNI_12039 [Pyricularia grisea]TLD04319.1 hypothetical protein PgNI_12039 [Pyricularia grisea]
MRSRRWSSKWFIPQIRQHRRGSLLVTKTLNHGFVAINTILGDRTRAQPESSSVALVFFWACLASANGNLW